MGMFCKDMTRNRLNERQKMAQRGRKSMESLMDQGGVAATPLRPDAPDLTEEEE
jgi:hypothetical protein